MIKVKYFGMMAEVAKCAEENLHFVNSELSEVISELNRKYSMNRYPVKIAINQVLVDQAAEKVLHENDEIAVLPPFSGG